MFETSFLLLIKALIVNILLPLIPGLLLMRLLFGDLLKGRKLYIVSRFLWAGLISNWIFDLQLIHFGAGVREYFMLIWVLLFGLVIKIWGFKFSSQKIISSLKIEKLSGLKNSFLSLTKFEKILTIAGSIFVVRFMVNSFVHTVNFPTYADDSFGNRHKPAINIYTDGGVKLFWSTGEILGRARLWYPIHVPIYKAVVSDFMWWWYDTYINLFQRIWFALLVFFGFLMTRKKTGNLFYSLLPWILICGLPLIFWHAIDWYHELPSIYYTILAVRALYRYLEEKDLNFLVLWSLFLWILSYVKNDGFVVYMPAVVIGFVVIQIFKRDFVNMIKSIWNKKRILWLLIWWIIVFLLPFLAIKQYYDLGFNQASGESSGVWLSHKVHREIFSQFDLIFFGENNYNLILLFVIFVWIFWYQILKPKTKNYNLFFLILVPVLLFGLFTLIFLVTDNYRFVMDQTTVNRTYVMCFVLLLFYFGMLRWSDDTKK